MLQLLFVLLKKQCIYKGKYTHVPKIEEFYKKFLFLHFTDIFRNEMFIKQQTSLTTAVFFTSSFSP